MAISTKPAKKTQVIEYDGSYLLLIMCRLELNHGCSIGKKLEETEEDV